MSNGGGSLLGFISKKKHKEVTENIRSHISTYVNVNFDLRNRNEGLQKQLELENRRAAYWKMKFLQPDKEPIILGNQSDIEYIKN